MEIEVIEPKKEYLRIPVNLDGAPEEVVEVVQAIKKVAEEVLYHWADFPIVLPPPLTVVTSDGEGSSKKEKPLIGMNLFVAPSFEECHAVSLDAKGNSQPLTEKQLKSIAETGRFEVESVNFPGQFYVYRLSQVLQKGKQKTSATFLRDIALALQLIVITARNRLFSQFFSLSQSICAFYYGVLLLLDAFIGIPALYVRKLSDRIQEERSKYLVAELTVRQNLEDDLDNLCQFIKYQLEKNDRHYRRKKIKNIPNVPCLYRTPTGLNIDMRHFCKEITREAFRIISVVLIKESNGWFIPFKEKVIAELKAKKIPDEDLERQANILVLDEYMKRIFNSILAHPDIQEMGTGIGALLVEHAQAVVLMHRAVDNMHRRLSQRLSQLEACLRESYPILSLIGSWVENRLRAAGSDFMLDHQWDAHEESLALCRQYGLEQIAYFLQRDLTFMREREAVLKQELSKDKVCNRSFTWNRKIWCPHHWKVSKLHQQQLEVVPTVISKTISSLVQSSSDPWSDSKQPYFFVEKSVVYTTTTRSFFWRWINYCYRTYCWTWNAIFFLGIVVPWCSPVSIRALCSVHPFKSNLELNDKDGILYPSSSSTTHTLCSWLSLLWRHISKSRTEFESRPETGFIGTGFNRRLNQLWNYFVKGVLGTMLFAIFFPVTCIVVSCLSVCAALSAPFWVPCSTLIFHILMVLAYDFDSPGRCYSDSVHLGPLDGPEHRHFDNSKRCHFNISAQCLPQNKICIVLEALVWHILILGIIQPAVALVVAFILCPIGSFFILLFAGLRYGFRIIWDFVIFRILIKKRGRVPVSDSWFIKCIAEPFPLNSYFQISPEQALAAFEAKLEIEELNAFREEVERIILLPQQTYSDFVLQCFQPFSAVLSKEGVFKMLGEEAENLLTTLHHPVQRRQQELQLDLSVNMQSKIQLPLSDLQLVLKQATEMCRQFYPIHVLKRLQVNENDFWEKRELANQDWLGLTSQLFAEIFSINFFTPLSETTAHQKVEARGMNLSRYTEMLKSAESIKDLDVRYYIHAPKSNINVHFPHLDPSIFNLYYTTPNTVQKEAKTKWLSNLFKLRKPKKLQNLHSQKLQIPLPLLHPIYIAVIIFNRENEEPITSLNSLRSGVLRDIINSAKCTLTVSYGSEDKSLDVLSVATTVDDYRDFPFMATTEPSASSENGLSGSSLEGSVLVNLASTEDISLEPEGQRVVYSHSSYSTTV